MMVFTNQSIPLSLIVRTFQAWTEIEQILNNSLKEDFQWSYCTEGIQTLLFCLKISRLEQCIIMKIIQTFLFQTDYLWTNK